MEAWLAIALLIVCPLLGALILARGRRGRPRLDRPRCARCGYDLRGAATLEAPCLECGRDLSAPRTVACGTWRPSAALLALGVCAVMLPWIVIAVMNWRESSTFLDQSVSVRRPEPTAALLAEAADAPQSSYDAWQELGHRVLEGGLTEAEISDALATIRTALPEAAGDQSHNTMHQAAEFLQAAHEADAIDTGQLLDVMLAHWGEPRLVARPAVRAEQPWPFQIDFGDPFDHAGFERWIEVSEVRVNGVSATSEAEMRLDLEGTVETDAPPGLHDLTMRVAYGIVPTRDSQAMRAHSSDQSATPLVQREMTFKRRIEVVPPEEPAVELVHDAATGEALRKAINVRSVRLHRVGEQTVAAVHVAVPQDPPVDLLFDVVLVVDGRKHMVGRLTRFGRTTSGNIHEKRISPVPADVRDAMVILRPNIERAEREPTIERLWGDPIDFGPMPIDRRDRPQ